MRSAAALLIVGGAALALTTKRVGSRPSAIAPVPPERTGTSEDIQEGRAEGTFYRYARHNFFVFFSLGVCMFVGAVVCAYVLAGPGTAMAERFYVAFDSADATVCIAGILGLVAAVTVAQALLSADREATSVAEVRAWRTIISLVSQPMSSLALAAALCLWTSRQLYQTWGTASFATVMAVGTIAVAVSSRSWEITRVLYYRDRVRESARSERRDCERKRIRAALSDFDRLANGRRQKLRLKLDLLQSPVVNPLPRLLHRGRVYLLASMVPGTAVALLAVAVAAVMQFTRSDGSIAWRVFALGLVWVFAVAFMWLSIGPLVVCIAAKRRNIRIARLTARIGAVAVWTILAGLLAVLLLTPAPVLAHILAILWIVVPTATPPLLWRTAVRKRRVRGPAWIVLVAAYRNLERRAAELDAAPARVMPGPKSWATPSRVAPAGDLVGVRVGGGADRSL